MKTNSISPVFADFNYQITQLQTQPNNQTVPQPKKEEKRVNKKLLTSLIAMGIIGAASIGVHYLSERRKIKLKYQAPVPKFTAPPPATHLKDEMELYLPSITPIHTGNVAKQASEYIDTSGNTIRTKVFPTGSIEETFHAGGESLSRKISQKIKRTDGFYDELNVFSSCSPSRKEVKGTITKDVGYGKIEIKHIKEYIKNAKGKYKLIKRQRIEIDDFLNPIHKFVEHLEDGTTRITLKNVSNNTQDIITRDRKGNIISQTFTFL